MLVSEFMAINNTTLADEDGTYSDWIELYNSGTNSVNLAGWYLSNKTNDLTQWKFPSTNIGPSSFLVVFASNKDRKAAGAPLHTNFKLSGAGEYLALVMPDGMTKASEFAPAFPPQFADISYGYAMTPDLVLVQPATYLYPPTPGRRNPNAGLSVVPQPVTFLPPGGTYTSNVLSVSLQASSSSETVHYTVDGSTPTASSPVYTSPLSIGKNSTIRALAEFNGVLGEVSAATYFLLDSTVTNFSSNLPLVIIDTLNQTIPDGAKIGSYAVFIDTNAVTGRAWLGGSPAYTGRLGIGLHGSSSLGFPKLPFAIELDDENGDSVNYPLLGFPAGNDWLLYPSYDDKTFMNNVLTEELFRAMGHYGVRCRYTELFLRSGAGKLTARDYQGIYILIERIRIDSNRVDIASLKNTDNVAPEVTGGYIISKDKINDANDVLITTESGQQLIVNRPAPADLTSAQYDYISGYVNELEAALYGANWRDPKAGYASYLDTGSCVDFHWIVEYSKNIDGIRISDYMSKDREGKLKMEPIWDWDLSWGNANYLEGGNTNGWYYPQLSDGDDIWLGRLRTDPDFHQKIIDRWGALRLNIFNATNLLARVDQLTNYLWEAQARDFTTWPRLGTYVWPNPDGPADGWDVDYVNPTTYAGIIAQFKKFILGRYLWIDQQFVPAPSLVTNGPVLSFGGPLGTIYYTLDGTDPRASGGAIGTSARPYSGTIMLTNNAAIFARVLYTNSWSAPARALYINTLPSLRITEINYHPAPPPANSPYSDKDFEFVEVQNTGSNIIDLAGTTIGGGINFTFAPSQLNPVGQATANTFDGGGTPFTSSTFGQGPGASLTNDGPSGTLLKLLESNTNIMRNRVAFDETATGSYDRVTVDFDFRGSSTNSASVGGVPTTQDFDSPGTAYTLSQVGQTAPIVLAADSGSSGNFLRLVPSSGNQLGMVAFAASSTGVFDSIISTFDFRITPPAGASPADGLGFALLNTSQYGTSGAGPFFAEEPNAAGSVGVGFDVYNNASTPQEPNNNHVSLHWNGAQIGNAVTPSFSLSNGKFNRAQVMVLFSGNNAYVTVRLTPDINGVAGPTETVLQNALISGVAPYPCRAAFGARTGGLWATHDLDNVNVQFSQYNTAAAGVSLLLLPASQFGTTGRGTSLSTFADWPQAADTMSLDLAFNPAEIFNDVSLYWNRALATSVPISPVTLGFGAGVFQHAHLELVSTDGGVSAALVLTANSLGVSGSPLIVFSNLFVQGATLADNRLEFAARNEGLPARIDLENVFARFERLAPLLLNPGASMVIVHNRAAFESRYGTGLPVAGEFSGSLNNAGDRLTLVGPLGEPILDFSYDPSWYPSTDGGGFSLVAADPNGVPAAWGLATNWRASAEPGGSPGAPEPVPGLVVLTVVSEVNPPQISLRWPANTDTYELFSAAALGQSGQWTAFTNAPALSDGYWTVSIPLSSRGCYYRLKKQ